jgi:type VI secretion system protein ImpK
MDRASDSMDSDRSTGWLQKGVETLTRIGRGPVSPQPQAAGNPLREVFSDLIAFVIYFESICEQAPPDLKEFRDKVIALLNAQEERAKTYGIGAEAFKEARYAVLSWVDEMVLNSKWSARNQWQHLMLAYYGTLNAGEEFFRRLNALPSNANDIREIYYLCISLGFQGELAFGEGTRELQALKQKLYKQIITTGGDIRQSYSRLFPEAYQKLNLSPQAKPKSNRIWYITGTIVVLLVFGVYWFFLQREANRIVSELTKTPSITPIIIDPLTSLVKELRNRNIPAEETSRGVVITLPSLLFGGGSAELNPDAERTITDIVETVKRHASDRSIVVEGHASKEGHPESNKILSERRARTVAESFARAGFRREKISSWGFGSEKPKPGANDAANRRVEIIVVK